jgi:hypothetical protein
MFLLTKFVNQAMDTSHSEKQDQCDGHNQERRSQIDCGRDRQPNPSPKRDVRGQAHWAFRNQRENRGRNNPADEIHNAPNN